MDVALALTVILNAVKDLLYVFAPLEIDNKQILRRCAPQNDIATSPQGDGRQSSTPIFEGAHEGREGLDVKAGLKPAPTKTSCSWFLRGGLYSALMFASFMTLPHLAVSATMYGPNSAGPNLSTSAP